MAAPLAWSRHPAAFDTWTLAAAAQATRLAPGGVLIDPFAATAASGTFAVSRGERFVGIDAHPLMVELGALKFTRPGPPDQLREAARALVAAAGATGGAEGEHELIMRSVGVDHASELAALRDGANSVAGEWAAHLRWAVVGALRDLAGPGWPAPQPRPRAGPTRSPAELVIQRVDRMAADLLLAPRRPEASVIGGDARDPAAWAQVPAGTADGCVTSPPYLNQVHWGETFRLEAFFLGAASTWRELLDLTQSRLVASSTQQVTVERAAAARGALARLPALDAAVEPLICQLEHARALKPRGKAYERLLPCYIVDMVAVLANLLVALRPGARAALLVGDSAPYDVLVDTPALLAIAAREVGFDVIEDRHLRVRGRRWPGVGHRHARRLSERLLVLARPDSPRQEPLPGLALV